MDMIRGDRGMIRIIREDKDSFSGYRNRIRGDMNMICGDST